MKLATSLTAIALLALSGIATADPLTPHERGEIHRDNRDIAHDRHDLRFDKHDLRQDRRSGDVQGVREDRHDVNADRRDLHGDRVERRHDVHDARF
jgi:hypothetical protein